MYERLEGQRIVLRKAKLSDAEAMLNYVWKDPKVYEWMLYQPTFTMTDALERCQRSIEYQKNNYAYFIALKDTDEAIGLCAIREMEPHHFKESGICIGSKFQGMGIGKEILSLLLDLAFNKLGAVDFQYAYFIDNIKSKKLALSFHFEYTHRELFIRPWDKLEKQIDFCILSKNDYLQVLEEKKFFDKLSMFFDSIGEAKKMVLSSSLNDKVTSRMMSIIIHHGFFFFQTDCSLRKYQQITKNPQVSLCIDNIEIEGLCEELSSSIEEKEFLSLYEKYYQSSFRMYSHLENERYFKITPTYIKKWVYIDKVPYEEIYDLVKKRYQLNEYVIK